MKSILIMLCVFIVSTANAAETHYNKLTLESRMTTVELDYHTAIEKFEQQFNFVKLNEIEEMTHRGEDPEDVRNALSNMVGDQSLVIFAKMPMSDLFPLLGGKKQNLTKYLIGNPYTARKLADKNRDAALFVPFVVVVYGDHHRTTFKYIVPSSFIPYLDRDDHETGEILDREIESRINKLATGK